MLCYTNLSFCLSREMLTSLFMDEQRSIMLVSAMCKMYDDKLHNDVQHSLLTLVYSFQCTSWIYEYERNVHLV